MAKQIGNIAVLGSTGSIGTQTLDVIRTHREQFCVVALSGNSNIELLIAQAREFSPQVVAVSDEKLAAQVRAELGSACSVLSGPNATCEAAAHTDVHTVLVAVVGFAGLAPVLAAAKAGKHIALANKESLVAGGELVVKTAKENGAALVPVDSEHSSIYQCLLARQPGDEISRITLTASGGPFLSTPISELSRMSPEEAVRHPRWAMGAKISVDSATLVNKGLEVIEAARLFDLSAEKISVLIHPQSIVHGLVEFVDHTALAALFETDMKIPIAYALGSLRSEDPQKSPGGRLPGLHSRQLDLSQWQLLQFIAPDKERFPALGLCYDALEVGQSAPLVVNAANELAVQAFLDRRISFTEIAEVLMEVMSHHTVVKVLEIGEIFEVDAGARELASNIIKKNQSPKKKIAQEK